MGPPLLILLTIGSIYLTIRLGFFQFKYAGYILKETFGKIFKKEEKGKGTISAFQALCSAVACTVGAGNITGVPVAILYGGAGSIFWMWIIALLSMALKFSEVALAVKYREQNDEGEFVGGPTYYMTRGLNMRWLAVWFALGLMFEVASSTMVQANSVAASAFENFNINPKITGIVLAIIVGMVIIGGIKRIGKVTELLVPFMATIYVVFAILITILNIDKLPYVISLILSNAFRPRAVFGGVAGYTLAATIRWGLARGVYSNESGLGTASIAHASATTDHPVRQALWAVTEVFLDTIIICSATGFSVLMSGVLDNVDLGAIEPGSLTALAFTQVFGSIGGKIVTISLMLFVVSTIIVLAWYGEKQAEFLFGLRYSKIVRYVYIASIVIGSVGGAKVLWQFLDITLAAILIPNLIAVLLLNNEVVELKEEFFKSEDYYMKDISKTM